MIFIRIILIIYLYLIIKKFSMLNWSHLRLCVQLLIRFTWYRLFVTSSLKLFNVYILKIRFFMLVYLWFLFLNLILIILRIKNLFWSLGQLTLRSKYSIHCSFPLFFCAQNLIFWRYQLAVFIIYFIILIVLVNVRILILVNFMTSIRSWPPFQID